MLIRTRPVKLHIGMGLSCGAESFSERIQGNYGLLGAHFAPKDLLFLMTEPPEAAESPAGMTVLVDQSGRQDTWNVTMDVMNNVVNRILLDGSERFTYQDQVYITTVLNRLGVTDTERFMTQVRQLRTESESTANLLALYREELTHLQEQQEAESRRPGPPARAEEGESPAAPAPDVELSLTILRRLDAVGSFQRLYDLRRSWFRPANYFQRNELQLSEQLRFGGSVSLEETKRQVFQNAWLSLVHRRDGGRTEEPPTAGGEPGLSQTAVTLPGTVERITALPAPERPPLAGEVSPEEAKEQVIQNTWLSLVHRQDGERTEEPPTAGGEPGPSRTAVTLPGTVERVTALPSSERSFSSSVFLEEAGRQVFRNVRLSLIHHLNRYELEEAPGMGGEPPLSQAAAAALSGAVDNVVVQILNRPELRRNQWLRLENALWQSGANSLARFTLYHEAPPPAAPASLSWSEENAWRRYAGELREYQTLRQYLYPRTVETTVPPALPGEASLTFLPVAGEETEELPVKTREPRGGEMVRRDVLRETDTLETARERLERVLKTEDRLSVSERTERESPALRHVERTETADRFRESVLETDMRQRELRRLERTLRERKIWPPAASVRERALRLEREILRQESLRTETPAAEERFYVPAPAGEAEAWTPPRLERREARSVPPLTLTAREAETLAPELLEEAIRQIDRQNRTILKALPPEGRESAPARLPAPDFRRTLKESLRSLSEPEALLREITEKRRIAEAAPPALTHREEMLLRQLPAEERKTYEAVLAYGKDPEGGFAQGVLRPGSLGELYGAIRQAERPAAELTHPAASEAAEAEQITERVETVLERFLGQPPRQERRAEPHAPPPAVKIIHKTAPEELAEEDRTEQRRTHTTVQTDSRREEVRRHEERQVDVRRQERTLVSETAEDITALVNRTLAGQMKSISEQVYRQMEKRLQMERSRRGRL